MLGAPIVGDAAYWKGRSTLWQAVLMEHAKKGYYDMPARGGRSDVSDAMIDAATEHMLSITFPDLPKDQ
jgi:cytochrome c5